MKHLVKFCRDKKIYFKVHRLIYARPYDKWGDGYDNGTLFVLQNIMFQILGGRQKAYLFFTYLCRWNLTEEGQTFWFNISQEWATFCRLKNITYLTPMSK